MIGLTDDLCPPPLRRRMQKRDRSSKSWTIKINPSSHDGRIKNRARRDQRPSSDFIPASTMIALKFALAIMIDLTDDPYHPPPHGPTTDGEDRSTSIVIISESIDHGRIKDRARRDERPWSDFNVKVSD
ncbi:unnamed protein product [Musa acuminata subsp. burmannicoides]